MVIHEWHTCVYISAVSITYKSFDEAVLCSNMKDSTDKVNDLATQQVPMYKAQTRKYVHTEVYKMI